MPADLWAPYLPDEKAPWDLPRVVHLHRRAALAATWGELRRYLANSPEKAVGRLLAGGANAHPAAEYDATAGLLFDAAVTQGEIGRLKAGWFFRFFLGPDLLREKLTLLWHDHFATANGKVRDVGLMRQQNDTLRKHAAGKFADLLNAAVREPALLLYFDAQTNRKGHANENLGRELLELFTFGVGDYTEADVKEAARALTGWSVDDGRFVEVAERHDGDKTILGTTAKFTGTQPVDLLVKQPAVAERVVKKLVRQFFGDGVVSPDAAKQLADGLRERDLDVAWAVGTALRSKLFFADANLRTRVLMPVEYVVGAARVLELFDPAPSTLAMADWSGRMGQDVFDPPNVGGWPVGAKWVHSRSLIARANYAAALVTGPNSGRSVTYDPAAQAKRHGARVLVVVEMDGGNDALNTVVPHADAEYARLRPRLKIDPKRLVKVTDAVGLHPSLRPLDKQLKAGRLAVLPGVGYPNPNRSHFDSMAMWQTARFDEAELRGYGWLGRAMDPSGGNLFAVGGEVPTALRGRRSSAVAFQRIEEVLLADPAAAKAGVGSEPADDLLAFVRRQAADAQTAADKLARLTGEKTGPSYPQTELAERLKIVAKLLKADVGARVFYAQQSGYDTHAQQQFTHANLLGEFAGAVAAFFADLKESKLDDRVTLLSFSEFGRTIKENGSAGTDHGTAGACFVAGPTVRAGLVGTVPSLTDLSGGEPLMTTDFRRVYHALTTGWMGLPADVGADELPAFELFRG